MKKGILSIILDLIVLVSPFGVVISSLFGSYAFTCVSGLFFVLFSVWFLKS